MKIVRATALIVAATAAVAGLSGPAFATTPATAPATVDSLKAKADTKASHITAKLQAMQTRLSAKPKLASARAALQADITKALADTAAWRKLVDAATTKAAVRAADPTHKAVKADLAKLHTDLTAAKTKAKAG